MVPRARPAGAPAGGLAGLALAADGTVSAAYRLGARPSARARRVHRARGAARRAGGDHRGLLAAAGAVSGASGAFTNLTVGSTLTVPSLVVAGGISATPVGAPTPRRGAFTALSASGAAALSATAVGVDGTAGAPALTVGAYDADTGLYRAGAGLLDVSLAAPRWRTSTPPGWSTPRSAAAA